MNSEKKLAIFILVVCVICMFVGIAGTVQKNAATKIQQENAKSPNVFGAGKNKIALVKLDGVISTEISSGFFTPDITAQNLINALSAIRKDNSVKGVIIKMNTPGGTVAMSQNVYDSVLETRKKIPVFVAMDDVAASGGYYIATAADRIYAQRGTLTGSIGVIFSTLDMHRLLADKLMITPNVIKSGKYKDLGSAYRTMNEEDKKLLEEIIDNTYQQFINDIVAGRVNRNDKYSTPKRNLSYSTLKTYADGRIFTGMQAYNLGFVDGVGDIELVHKAITRAAIEKFKLNDKELQLVPYSKSSSLTEIFTGVSETIFNKKTNAFSEYLPASVKMGRQPLYLWE